MPVPRRRPRRTLTAAAAVVAALTVTGCGPADPDPAADGPAGTAAEQSAAAELAVADARNLVAQLTTVHATTGTYPETSQDATTGFTLADGNRVASYANHGHTNVVVCVANDTYGAWAKYDAATGLLGSGSGEPADALSGSCAAG